MKIVKYFSPMLCKSCHKNPVAYKATVENMLLRSQEEWGLCKFCAQSLILHVLDVQNQFNKFFS